MICVVQRDLVVADMDLEGQPSAGNALLLAPEDAHTQDGWRVHGQEQAMDLPQAWKGLVRPAPAMNRILLAWSSPDQYLFELLQFVHRQQAEYKVSVSLLLAGPLNPEMSFDAILSLRDGQDEDRFVNTIWYVGNEDSGKREVSPAERDRLLSEMLSLLLAGNDGLFDAMRLYPPNQDPPPFTAFGIRSWLPPVDSAMEVVRYTSASVIRDELADRKSSSGIDESTCRNETSSILEKLRVLNTPYANDKTNGESPPVQFCQRLSYPPQNPFGKWISPMLREIAVIKGKARIMSHRGSWTEYYRGLQSELLSLGNEIRQNGQALFDATRKSCREFLSQSPSLPQIETFLRVYFPAMRPKAASDTRSPCESASVPGLSDCEKWFVKDAIVELETECKALPTIRNAVGVGAVTLLLVFVSCALLYFQMDWDLIVAPTVCAAFVIGGFLLWAAYRAKRVVAFMSEYFDQRYTEVREKYSGKLEWVVNNTHTVLERQLLAEISGIGYRLKKNYQDLFAEWNKYADREGESKLSELLWKMELEAHDTEPIRDKVRKSAADLLEDALREAPPIAGKRKAQELKEVLAREIIRRVRTKTVEYDRVAVGLVDCLSREDPPVMARLNSAQLTDAKTHKVFLLPESYPKHECEDILGARSRRAGLDARFWRGKISAPAVLMARSHLTLDEMKTTLIVTEVR